MQVMRRMKALLSDLIDALPNERVPALRSQLKRLEAPSPGLFRISRINWRRLRRTGKDSVQLAGLVRERHHKCARTESSRKECIAGCLGRIVME